MWALALSGLSVRATDILGETNWVTETSDNCLRKDGDTISLPTWGNQPVLLKGAVCSTLYSRLDRKVWTSLESQTWQVVIFFSDTFISNENCQKIQVILTWEQASNIFQSLLSFCLTWFVLTSQPFLFFSPWNILILAWTFGRITLVYVSGEGKAGQGWI